MTERSVLSDGCALDRSNTLGMSATFVGRDDDLRVFREELAAARSGRPRVVVLEGQAGMGKTTLVERFVAEAHDARVVQTSGDESETDVELAVLDQLLRRAVARGVIPSPGGHVEAGTRLLEALADLQADGSAIVVVDDAQWVDAASLRALLFAVRRLVSDCVLIVVVVREGQAGTLPDGLRKLTSGSVVRHLRLAPLAEDELRALADAYGVPLSARAARRLHEYSGGSPLYARELLTELPRRFWEVSSGPPPAPRTYAELVRGRLRSLPDEAVRLAEAASVLGVRSPLATAITVAGLADPDRAIDALLTSQHTAGPPLANLTVGFSGPELRFAHPLVRAAIYGGIAHSRRARMHEAAAAALEDQSAALTHRVAAASGPDAALADELAAYGARCVESQRWSSAASSFEAASRVSARREDREQYLLAAIEASMFGGDSPRARILAAETDDFVAGPRLDAVLAYVAFGTGRREEAEQRLRRAWDGHQSSDVGARVAERLAFLGVLQMRAPDAVSWAEKARALAPAGDPRNAPAALWLALGLHWLGRASEAFAVLDAERARFGRSLGAIPGTLLLADDEIAAATADLAAEEPVAVGSGSLIVAARVLAKHAQARFAGGEWDAAVVLADRAQALALESDDVAAEALAGWAAVLVPAARGDRAECDRLQLMLERLPVVFAGHIAERNLGLALLAAARADHAGVLEVLAPLATLEPREAIDAPGHYPWAHLYGAALVALERPDADAFLHAQHTLADARGARSQCARLALVRGEMELMRDDPPAAFAALERAEDMVPEALPYEQALIDFGIGRCLRRVRRRRAAAERLAQARDTFAALGANPILALCERELEACGLTPTKRRGDIDRSRLTPQERSVAKLAAAGASNREIAAHLLISVKSVERYLTQIYRKLGVGSRGELAAHFS